MNRHHHPRNWLMKACFGIAFIVFGLIVVAGLTTIGSTQIAPSETRVCHQQQFIELTQANGMPIDLTVSQIITVTANNGLYVSKAQSLVSTMDGRQYAVREGADKIMAALRIAQCQ
ncbi:MAG: hypothetical protein ACHQWH_03040 [Nitrososphaerales archaeon]|jgi:phosphate/sulfate permease